jgi:hypothetical protein
MKTAVVGLAYTHPYTYTQILQRTGHAVMFLEKGVPTYSSKPAAVSLEQLQRLASVVRRTGTPCGRVRGRYPILDS